MNVKRSGSNPSQKAPAEHFTGTVRVDPLFQSSAPARTGGAYVTFEPWHGAAPTTHLAIQESIEGKNVEWLEKVTDEQYGARPSAQEGT